MARLPPLRRAAVALAVALSLGAPAVAGAQGDPYKLHMENGVKLYNDKNYAAAMAEFQAAYDARPSPNPLLNIALCDKELFRYPQAIAALETALAKHGEAMDADDRKTSQDAIREMRALLGSVTVSLTPPGATLLVDGEEQPPGVAGKVLLLGPGVHKIGARAPGHAAAEQRVTVSSGGAQAVTLALLADKGSVSIEGPDPQTILSLDDHPVGTGTWSGLVDPGPHVVQMLTPGGQPYRMTIVVAPGVPLQVRKGEGGVAVPPPTPEDPQRRGLYVLAMGSTIFAVTHPPNFPGSPMALPDFGAGYGVRAGFQVNAFTGFEATYEHSSIYTYAHQLDPSSTASIDYYRIIANRFAASLRVISVGRWLRFVGSFGGGFVYDDFSVNTQSANGTYCLKHTTTNPGAGPNNNAGFCYFFGSGDHTGVDAFALVEAGAEFDIDHVLVDLVAEGQIQSTGNITGVGSRPLFGAVPLINAGPALRIGYRFW